MTKIVGIAQGRKLDLDKIMAFRLTDDPLAIFNPNGSMRKVVKSQLAEKLNLEIVCKDKIHGSKVAVDMGFLWRYGSPTAQDREKADKSDYLWEDYAKKLFQMIQKRHPEASEIYMVNDRYDVDNSIKDSGHLRRASTIKNFSGNVFPKSTQNFPSSKEFNAFFMNSSNKIRLQTYLLHELISLSKETEKKLFYNHGTNCIDLETSERIPHLDCHQHEADTKMFFYSSQISQTDPTNPIVIDAEDTDVLVIAAQASHDIAAPMFLYRRGKLYNCSKMEKEDVARYIIQLHVLSGCDSVSGFFDHGKQAIFSSASRAGADIQELQRLGTSLTCNNELLKGVVKSILCFVYKEKETTRINISRAKRWNSMKKKNTARLPPDEDSLYLHIRRANYQAHIFRSYADPSAPVPPYDDGWVSNDQGYLELIRSTIASIPEDSKEISTEMDAAEGQADNDYASSLEDDDSDDSDDSLALSDECDSEEEPNRLTLIDDSLQLKLNGQKFVSFIFTA